MFSTKVYPLSLVEQQQLNEFLDENLKSRCICPLKSPMTYPVFLINKKYGNLHLIQDYWKLNEMTMKNTYPLLLISDMLNKVSKAKAKYFTKLDVCGGYNNMQIKEGDEWKASFQMNQDLFKPLIMFFGLMSSKIPDNDE